MGKWNHAEAWPRQWDISTSYDGNSKAIKGQSRQDKIIAEINKYSNLTRAEKSALYHMFYESDKNNPWA